MMNRTIAAVSVRHLAYAELSADDVRMPGAPLIDAWTARGVHLRLGRFEVLVSVSPVRAGLSQLARDGLAWIIGTARYLAWRRGEDHFHNVAV